MSFRMRFRAITAAGIAIMAASVACTTAPPALAAAPTQFCAIVGAPATALDAASPVLGQGCFATLDAEHAYVKGTLATTSLSAGVSPLTSYHLGVAYSGENYGGSRYDFYGSNPGTCSGGNYYQFSNLHGPFDSAADDLGSGANCEDAYYWSGSNFDGRDWDCYAIYEVPNSVQSCEPRMPAGDDGAAHSVRFRS